MCSYSPVIQTVRKQLPLFIKCIDKPGNWKSIRPSSHSLISARFHYRSVSVSVILLATRMLTLRSIWLSIGVRLLKELMQRAKISEHLFNCSVMNNKETFKWITFYCWRCRIDDNFGLERRWSVNTFPLKVPTNFNLKREMCIFAIMWLPLSE